MGNGILNHRIAIVAALGTTQTLAWASSYYLAAIIAIAAVEVVVTGSEVVVEPAGGAVLEVVEGPEEHAATRATRRMRDRRIGGAKGTLRIAATRRFTATFGPTSPGGVGCLMQS